MVASTLLVVELPPERPAMHRPLLVALGLILSAGSFAAGHQQINRSQVGATDPAVLRQQLSKLRAVAGQPIPKSVQTNAVQAQPQGRAKPTSAPKSPEWYEVRHKLLKDRLPVDVPEGAILSREWFDVALIQPKGAGKKKALALMAAAKHFMRGHARLSKMYADLSSDHRKSSDPTDVYADNGLTKQGRLIGPHARRVAMKKLARGIIGPPDQSWYKKYVFTHLGAGGSLSHSSMGRVAERLANEGQITSQAQMLAAVRKYLHPGEGGPGGGGLTASGLGGSGSLRIGAAAAFRIGGMSQAAEAMNSLKSRSGNQGSSLRRVMQMGRSRLSRSNQSIKGSHRL